MTNEPDKLDCFVRVVTPENIAFEYSLAGPFQRLPAFIFDIGVRALIFTALLFVGGFVLSWVPLGGTLVGIAAILMFFLFSWFYGVFFETRFNGRTIGKMVFRLRTISTDGRPINASQAALRNLLRLADMNVLISLQMFSPDAPPMYMIPTMFFGLTAMTLTTRMQRIGDLAAGTMVVSEQRKRTASNIFPEDVRAFGLAELIPANFVPSSSLAQTIGLYMENRKRLNAMRRNDVAAHLAGPLIRQLELLPDTSPDLLLCSLYVRTYLSEEQQRLGRQQLRDMNMSRRIQPNLAARGLVSGAVRTQAGPTGSGPIHTAPTKTTPPSSGPVPAQQTDVMTQSVPPAIPPTAPPANPPTLSPTPVRDGQNSTTNTNSQPAGEEPSDA